jgi:omega-amidase
MLPPPDKDDDGSGGSDESSRRMKHPHYSAWGHSSVVSPWGDVIATCDEGPAVVVADLDMNLVTQMRTAIPTIMQKRTDLYRLIDGGGDGAV